MSPSAFSRRAVVSYWQKYVHEVLVNRLGGLSLPRKSVVRLTDRPDITLDVYRGRKTTIQQQQQFYSQHHVYNPPENVSYKKKKKKKRMGKTWEKDEKAMIRYRFSWFTHAVLNSKTEQTAIHSAQPRHAIIPRGKAPRF